MGVRQVIKKLDAFPCAEEHLLHKTKSGALDAPGGRRVGSERASPSVQLKEPTTEQRIVLSQKNQLSYTHELIIPKDEPIDELAG